MYHCAQTSFFHHAWHEKYPDVNIFYNDSRNFQLDKRYQIFTFFESPSEKFFRSFLFYGYKKEVRTSDNKETLQALPHIDFSLINLFTDRYMFFYLNQCTESTVMIYGNESALQNMNRIHIGLVASVPEWC